MIDRLERRGLVNRLRSTRDRRCVLAALTDHGRVLAEAAPDLLQPEFIRDYERLPDWERNMLVAALQRVAELMGTETARAPTSADDALAPAPPAPA